MHFRTGFADVDITDTNLNALCPWTENPVTAPVSELDSIATVDAEESLNEPFISPQEEELESGIAPEEEEVESAVDPEEEELGSDSALEEDYSSSGAPSSSAASEPKGVESISISAPEELGSDALHEGKQDLTKILYIISLRNP